MSRAGCDCGATWTGTKLEHCMGCHQTFTNTAAGDRHRVGDHAVSEGPNARRCADPADRGLTLRANGAWGLPAPTVAPTWRTNRPASIVRHSPDATEPAPAMGNTP